MSDQKTHDIICENCGKPSQEHWATNYSAGPHVSTTVLICPTSIFKLQSGVQSERSKRYQKDVKDQAKPAPAAPLSEAQVVYERNEEFDMHSGPYGYERVGFRIGDRVFWTGCCVYTMAEGGYAEDRLLAEEIVKRWNTVPQPPR